MQKHNDITCINIMRTLKFLMVHSNFSGLVTNQKRGPISKYSIQEPLGETDTATMLLEIEGKKFLIVTCQVA